jgi:hypothetical protein
MLKKIAALQSGELTMNKNENLAISLSAVTASTSESSFLTIRALPSTVSGETLALTANIM